jgi:hypothetical protein
MLISRRYISTVTSLFLTSILIAQSYQNPSDYFFRSAALYHVSNNNLLSFQNTDPQFLNTDSFAGAKRPIIFKKNRFLNYLLNKNLLFVKDSSDEFELSINPILDLKYFRSNVKTDQRLYLNTRGVAAECSFGKKIFFHTSFIENQAILPDYLDSSFRSLNTSLGEGRYKTFKTTGFQK